VGGFTKGLGGDWTIALSGTLSRTEQSGTVTLINAPGPIPPRSIGFDARLLEGDAVLSGSLLALPGGNMKIALSAGARSERGIQKSSGGTTKIQRTVKNVAAELAMPIIGERNQTSWAHALEVAIAARYDYYTDVGSTTNPKFGIRWMPIDGVNFRGSFGTSFHAPSLAQLISIPSYVVFPIPDPNAPSGSSNTLFFFDSGNDTLKPEKARSFSASVELDQRLLAGLTARATYFNTKFRNRISNPPIAGSLFSIYSESQLEAFFDFNPSLAFVQSLYATGTVFDPLGIGADNVDAIFFDRLQNVAVQRQSGIDFGASYKINGSFPDVTLFVAGTYLLKNKFFATVSSPPVSLLNRVGEPIDLKVHGGASLQWRNLGMTATVNYADSYKNNFVSPAANIHSWTTLDFQLRYDTDGAMAPPLRNIRLALTVENAFDRNPPFVTTPGGDALVQVNYDAANANPLGRTISFQLTKEW
jgi:outer membrane receptor protein involved in Fe transport